MAKTSLTSWSLVAFARTYGRMQVGSFVNEDGIPFKSCVFTDADGTRRFVGFAQKLGELSPKEIASRKNELQVVITENGKYKLCKKGNPGESWEDVDLGI